HPPLHSFPTRRSSDLWTSRKAQAYAEYGVSVVVATSSSLVDAHLADLSTRHQDVPKRGLGLIVRPGGKLRVLIGQGRHDEPVLRSEEHTSELQSQSNL